MTTAQKMESEAMQNLTSSLNLIHETLTNKASMSQERVERFLGEMELPNSIHHDNLNSP